MVQNSMNTPKQIEDDRPLWDIVLGVYGYPALLLAHKLKIFPLLADGPLLPEQWGMVQQHPEVGHAILNHFDHPTARLAASIALHHHERFDGTGYPHGLNGLDIPLEARIVAVCDVYDALRSHRPYKTARSHDDALRIMLDGDGRTAPEHFDPVILAAFAKLSADQLAG